MADDVEMTPVEMTLVDAAEPPKANPLASPKVSTLKLTPQARPPATTAAPSVQKPGLKLPTVGLKPGLKLPPKPGAAAAGLKLPVTGLKSGLKLPPKPGAATDSRLGLKLPTQTALKPGLKLPVKPVIRKPGATVAVMPLPKPVVPVAATAKPSEAPAAPVAKLVSVDAQGVGKLPTVEAKAVERNDTTPVVSENPSPMEALKSVTQKLKGITQEIPQQAILHKTGIIADGAMSDAQKEAAKHKTARISLSDAMGVAPVKDEHAPMKTIRIKRPIDIPGAANSAESQIPAAADTTDVSSGDATPVAAPAATITQRKTLKISRPGSAVRPSGKFGIRRPSQALAAVNPKASDAEGSKAAPAEDGAVSATEVADIPEMPNVPVSAPVAAKDDVPDWLVTLSSLVQAAACVVIGALAWFLWENAQLPLFCGGLGWGS